MIMYERTDGLMTMCLPLRENRKNLMKNIKNVLVLRSERVQ